MTDDEIRERLAGLPTATMRLSGFWHDTDEVKIRGPLTKEVRRMGWFHWRVAYLGTTVPGVPVVIMPGPRHWFRRRALRQLRGGA